MKKDDKEKIDIPRLNDLIKLGRNMFKALWVVMIIALILLITYILKEWKLLEFIGTIFKILSPLFIGIVIAWLLDPLVGWLQKNGIKRPIAVVLVFLFFISILVILFALMIPALGDQLNELINSAPRIVDYLKNFGEDFFGKLSDVYNYDFTSIKDGIYTSVTGLITSITIDLPNKVIGLISSIVSGGINILLGFIIGFYMLFDFNNVRKHLLNLLPKKFHNDAITLTDSLNKSLKSFVQGTLIIMVILFVFQSVALGIAGLSSPMLFGLFCAVTNIIPYFGPYIGGIPAVIVGFTISPMVGIGTLIAVVIAQLLESYFLNPIVMSKTMKLHPVTIMIGLLIFGHFFGMLGMILATPVIACFKIIFNFFNEKYEILKKINN